MADRRASGQTIKNKEPKRRSRRHMQQTNTNTQKRNENSKFQIKPKTKHMDPHSIRHRGSLSAAASERWHRPSVSVSRSCTICPLKTRHYDLLSTAGKRARDVPAWTCFWGGRVDRYKSAFRYCMLEIIRFSPFSKAWKGGYKFS